jgi:hypothetical protein
MAWLQAMRGIGAKKSRCTETVRCCFLSRIANMKILLGKAGGIPRGADETIAQNCWGTLQWPVSSRQID